MLQSHGIRSLFGIQIDYSDRKVPLGICSTCQRGIYDFNKTGVNSKNLNYFKKQGNIRDLITSKLLQQLGQCKFALVTFALLQKGLLMLLVSAGLLGLLKRF